LKFLRQKTPRIVHIKAKKQLAVEMPAKKDHVKKVWRKVVETNSPPQPPSIAVEIRMKTLMRTLLSLRTEVQPRYIQGTISYREVSRETYTKQTTARTMNTMIARVLYRTRCVACWPSSVVRRKSTQRPMEAITQKKASWRPIENVRVNL